MVMNVDGKMLRGLEQELEVDLIPGTEIMIDFGKPHFVKATGSDCVLVHQPSSSPHDPLNWSPKSKFFVIANALLSSFAQGFGPLLLHPNLDHTSSILTQI
jgi:hypothetical protein